MLEPMVACAEPELTVKPLPDAEAFVVSDKKRNRSKKKVNVNRAILVPPTPMMQYLSDGNKAEFERYQAEISRRFVSRIPLEITRMSTVYRVTDTRGKKYALKELHPISQTKKQQKALKEFQNAKLLRGHPNIIRYHTYWRFGPYICFLMEYQSSGSLERYVLENPLHDPVCHCEKEMVWYFLRDLLKGLAFMHQKNILHLDIKPANILISHRPGSTIPVLKIADFGLSRTLDSKSTKIGDGRYLAPELLETKPIISPAADIFSLGVTIYEIAGDYTSNDALWDHIINECISYDKISKELKEVLSLMLFKQPAMRITASNCLLINDKLQHLSDNNYHLNTSDHLYEKIESTSI